MKKIGIALLAFAVQWSAFSGTAKSSENITPIVFVHGLLASGDTYANMFIYFTINDFPADHLFAFDYNSLNSFGGSSLDTAGLDDFIDEVLQKTGASQVHLVGHSLGGATGYQYLSNATYAAKVARYVHVGSSPQPAVAGPNADVPTMNIYSVDDMVTQGADIPGATNVALTGKDHYEVATCEETFVAMYQFFNNGQSPCALQVVPKTIVNLSGKVVSLGENMPKPNATVRAFEVNPATGERTSSNPAFTLAINSKGEWGPHAVNVGTYLEFEVNPNDTTDRIVHYYYEGFTHDNPLVYLRTLPPPTGLTAALVNALPKDDSQSVVVLFAANQAVIHGRDSLEVEGVVLSTPDFCSAVDNTIAFFLYDDGDYQTGINFNPPPVFSSFQFLEGADIYFQTDTPQSIHSVFNGRSLYMRNWKSATEGVSIAVFHQEEFNPQICSGISNLSTGTISVYPNPGVGNFMIELQDVKASIASIEVLTLEGKSLIRREVPGDGYGLTYRLNLSDYPSGTYLLKLNCNDMAVTKKLVVNK